MSLPEGVTAVFDRDYVVTKVPRFTFEKFPDADANLNTSMKSVGEVMAIGRTFAESLQKALRSMETGLTGLNEVEIDVLDGEDKSDPEATKAAIALPFPHVSVNLSNMVAPPTVSLDEA